LELVSVFGLKPLFEQRAHQRIDRETLAQHRPKGGAKSAAAVHEVEIEARAAVKGELGQHSIAKGVDGEEGSALEIGKGVFQPQARGLTDGCRLMPGRCGLRTARAPTQDSLNRVAD